MSWRTAIEINHDYLHDIAKCPDFAENLRLLLGVGDFRELDQLPGVTYIGTRHHADSAVYEVPQRKQKASE